MLRLVISVNFFSQQLRQSKLQMSNPNFKMINNYQDSPSNPGTNVSIYLKINLFILFSRYFLFVQGLPEALIISDHGGVS